MVAKESRIAAIYIPVMLVEGEIVENWAGTLALT
jgi:hypothetical protein